MSATYLQRSDAEQLANRMSKADASDANRQITGMVILRTCGAFLGLLFLAVNAYQATWALMKLSGAASGAGIYGGSLSTLTADQWTIGATAFGLIFAAQVIAVRMVMASGAWRFFGVILLAGLMGFSVLTSAIHIGFNIQGGVIEATRQTDEYKMAKQRLETAMASKPAAEQRWTDYQASVAGGDPWSLNTTHSRGPGRSYVEAIRGADAEIAAARADFNRVKESGGGSAMGDIVGAIAGWFGTDTATFALWFGIFTVLLMEGVRVYLSFLTGLYLMKVMDAVMAERREAAEGQGVEDDAEPSRRDPAPARTMAADASNARDAVRGPVLSDPIEVEDDTPRAMFAPRKPRSEPADRVPDNKRQANYSKKLATLKDALERGDVKAGQVVKVGDMVGGNRKTVSALRNDLAASGLAHWRGNRLVAGAA